MARGLVLILIFFCGACFSKSEGPQGRELTDGEKLQVTAVFESWNNVDELPNISSEDLNLTLLRIATLEEDDFKKFCWHCGPGRCASGECETCAAGCLELNYSNPTIIEHVDTTKERTYCKVIIHETLHYLEYVAFGISGIDYYHQSELVWSGENSLIKNIPIENCKEERL